MKIYKKLFLIVFIILVVIALLQIFEPSIGSKISNILTIFTTIIGFVSVFFEMKRSADIDECSFILETFKHFTSDSNSGLFKIYEKLDLLFSEGVNTISIDDRKNMTQYLQFFEMIANLINKDTLSIEDIDSLYGYPFFIATNCKSIQEIELLPCKEYYEGIFKIYPIWYNFRVLHKKPIPFSDTLLVIQNDSKEKVKRKSVK